MTNQKEQDMAEKAKHQQGQAPIDRLRNYQVEVIRTLAIARRRLCADGQTPDKFVSDWQQYLVENLQDGDVPLRYRKWRLHKYPLPWQERAVDFIVGKDATTLFLTGCIGSKKTSFACAILLAWRASGMWLQPDGGHLVSFFVPAYEAARTYRDVSNPHWEIEQWERAAFLVLDDLGANRFTPHLTEQLLLLIQRRYDNCLKTIITSNLSLDEIKRDIDERASSRLAEGMCLDTGLVDARKEKDDAADPNN